MESQNFKNVRLIIGEPSDDIRSVLTSALSAKGFDPEYIQDTNKVSVIRDAVVNNQADLIVCDARLTDGDFDNLVHQVRHHEVGTNPFVNIITLVPTTADKQTITKSMDSGADDIMIKPIAQGDIMERIKHMIHGRKPFVITTDYIGPNRRTKHRPGTQKIPQIEVPNPLKAKVEGKPDEDKLQAEIDAMAEVLNEQKIERHAYQIVYLVERLIPAYDKFPINESAVADLVDRLRSVSNDISRRVDGSRYTNWKGLCLKLVDVVGCIEETPIAPNEKDLKNLRNLAEIFKYDNSPADQRG